MIGDFRLREAGPARPALFLGMPLSTARHLHQRKYSGLAIILLEGVPSCGVEHVGELPLLDLEHFILSLDSRAQGSSGLNTGISISVPISKIVVD